MICGGHAGKAHLKQLQSQAKRRIYYYYYYYYYYLIESSHNVFIRFRPKHIYLERLHYHVSTNLGLLQANMSNEYEQQGPTYHWKTELYKRLNLPVYDGVEEELEKQNKKGKKALNIFKSEKTMRSRVALRVQEAQERILWTKQHGQDTYGRSSEIIQGEKKVGTKPVKRLCTKVWIQYAFLANSSLVPIQQQENALDQKLYKGCRLCQ